METNCKMLDKNKVQIDCTIEQKVVEEKYKNLLKEVKTKASIPGFRRGKAPIFLIEKKFGPEYFYSEIQRDLIPESYEEALNKNNFTPIAQPEFNDINIDKDKGLTFQVTVEIQPIPEINIENISVEKRVLKFKESMIEKELKSFQEKHSTLMEMTEDREVQDKDFVIIDYVGRLDGEEFPGGSAKNHQLEIGSKSFIEGFEDNVIGMKKEEEKAFKVTFPKDYNSADLAGKEAEFTVKLHEIKTREVKELDDELVSKNSPHKTVDEFKKTLEDRIKLNLDSSANRMLDNNILSELSKRTEIDVAERLLDKEVENEMSRLEENLKRSQKNIKEYLKESGKKYTELKKEMRETAEDKLKKELILKQISTQYNIEIDEEDIKNRMEEMAKNTGISIDTLVKLNYNNFIEDEVMKEKIFSFLREKVEINTVEVEKVEDLAVEK